METAAPDAMRQLKLTVEYDGTDFHGFQRQPGRRERPRGAWPAPEGRCGLRTVQGTLEKAFSRALGEPIQVVGAGRTDAGVHALGQVVSFGLSRPVPTERVAQVLNAALPGDVKVQSCEEVEASFHARRDARSRTYRYRVVEGAGPSPLRGRFALVTPARLSVELMEEAARALVGQHDFRAFQASGSKAKTTERILLQLSCWRECGEVRITAEADSFLYRMVRLMVGGLLAVGRGELEPDALAEALETGERPAGAKTPAPACGLCLMQVSYAGPDTRAGKSEDASGNESRS